MTLQLSTRIDPPRFPWPMSTAARRMYAERGAVILPHLAPDPLIDAYCAAFEEAEVRPHGWPHCTAYADVPAMRELLLCHDIVNMVEHLLGEPSLLHLTLTGWVSTERAFHQDSYLNGPQVGDYYIAIWIALDDISPRSGPFEYLPGSHLWPVITQEALFAELTPQQRSDPDWPKFTEGLVVPLYEAEIARRGVQPVPFLARRGDVLMWSSRTVHRGSLPRDPGSERRALIAHYSGVNHRDDMQARVREGAGMWYDAG